VLGPKTVPKRTIELVEKSVLNEDQVCKIHKMIPEKTYNVVLEE
jgi:predicted urease superfamily metal-dependent hydrolase